MVGKTESAEHELMRKALADWFTTQGLSNVKTPADPVADMVPDVQADYFAKIVYGEAKLCEDFATPDTKDELLNYCGASRPNTSSSSGFRRAASPPFNGPSRSGGSRTASSSWRSDRRSCRAGVLRSRVAV